MVGGLTELLLRCREGDEQAYATLVRRFHDRAYDVARAFVHDSHLAEDAVQNAFLTAFCRLQDLREPAAFPGWFRQIVRTEASRIIRRRSDNTDGPASENPSGDLSPNSGAELTELRQIVHHAVNSLPVKARETAKMFYLDELSHNEIANQLEISAGTVKSRLHRARQRLRNLLLGYVEGTGPKKPLLRDDQQMTL